MKSKLTLLTSVAALAASGTAYGFGPVLTPSTALPSSATLGPTGGPRETTIPFDLPIGYSQQVIAVRNNIGGSGLTQTADLPNTGNWDMITLNETGPDAGRYLFSVQETGNAGMHRTDLVTGKTVTMFGATGGGLVAFDPASWTPWGTVITGEESWGTGSTKGRLFELTNPLADPASAVVIERTAIPNVAHEGMKFDAAGNFYFVDELNGGGIYKFVPTNPNSPAALTQGQTFVLKDTDALDGTLKGAAEWVALTDATGGTLSGITNPTVDGRQAANDVGATDYQRPEDLEISRLGNGNEVLYVATTTDEKVFSIELTSTPTVREFANNSTINLSSGLALGGQLDNPDNLAVDAWGNIYIIEDNGAGDIWQALDTDHDGIAETLGRWASLSTRGAEPTGLYFSPFDPYTSYVNVQHPSSGNDVLVRINFVPDFGTSTASLLLLAMGAMPWLKRRF